MELKIIPASYADTDAVVSLLGEQMAEHRMELLPDRLRNAITAVLDDDRLGFILIARIDDRVAGCIFVSFIWSMEHVGRVAWVEELFVDPEYRRRGVGSALLVEAMKRAEGEGCRAVDLEVDGSHSAAAALYERCGFVRLDRTRWAKDLDGV